jgi:hypothetical protein
LGVSREMEEPAFRGMTFAEVDWERGEGDLIPGLWCGFPFVSWPFARLRGSCLGELAGGMKGDILGGEGLTSTKGLDVPAQVADGFPLVELVKSPTSYRLSWCHLIPQGSLGSKMSTWSGPYIAGGAKFVADELLVNEDDEFEKDPLGLLAFA